jgi:hypothetical protein
MIRIYCDKCMNEIRRDLGVGNQTIYSLVVTEVEDAANRDAGIPQKVEGRFEHLCRWCKMRVLELVPRPERKTQ